MAEDSRIIDNGISINQSEQRKCALARLTIPMSSHNWFTLEEAQQYHVALTLEAFEWNQSLVAKVLGIDRRTLSRMIERWKLVNVSGHDGRTKK